jgi:hypothetical protein
MDITQKEQKEKRKKLLSDLVNEIKNKKNSYFRTYINDYGSAKFQ